MTRSYSTLLSWLGLLIVASVMLYHTSDRVNELDRQLHKINAQIEGEEEHLHVLKAEWVYLSNPARVEAATRRHLTLQPTEPKRVSMLDNLGRLLPLKSGFEPATPIQIAQAPAPRVIANEAHSPAERVVARMNAGRINDHMIMQHTASVEPASDHLGALIGTLGLRP